jgi:hypothetical protein
LVKWPGYINNPVVLSRQSAEGLHFRCFEA